MTTPIPTTDLAVDDIELGDIEQWMRPDREGIFAKLRAERPVSFHAEPVPPPDVPFPQGPGFWALTRYADVMQVSRDPETFHSAPSINIGDIPPEIAEWLGSMINITIVRELGPVLAATMLAGRIGSAMSAELATMRVTEQVDALSCLGAHPLHYLVVPRVLACGLLIPLLTVWRISWV